MASLTSQLLVRLIDGVSKPAKAAASALGGIGKSFKGLDGMQSRLQGAIERNNTALDRARGRMVDAVATTYALRSAFTSTVGAAVRFESAMADVAKVSGFDDSGLLKFGKQLRRLAVTEIPMAVEELAALAANAAQAGVSDSELLPFTEMTAKAAIAWEMSGAAAGEALAKIRSQLNLTTSQTGLFADAINHLSDNSAASAGDLVDYAKRVSAQGEFFGFAKEQTLAFGSAMIGAGAESEVAATSFRNMGRALTRGASATKAQTRAYTTLGLNSKKVAKAMQKDAVGTTLKVIEKLGQLPKEMQASVMSDLFGDEARALAPLLNDIDILKKALGLVADETQYASSVANEFARRAKTTEYAWQRFKNQMNEVGLAIGGSLLPALRQVMDTLGPLVITFADWAEGNPKLVSSVIMLAAGLLGLRIAMAGLNFLALVGKGGVLTLLAGGLRAVTAAGRPVVGFFQTLALRASLAAKATGKAPSALARLGDALTVLARGAGLRTVVRLLSRFGVVGAAAAAASTLIYQNWSGIKEFFAGFAEAFAKGIEPLQPTIDRIKELLAPFASVLAPVKDALMMVFDPIGTMIDKLAPLAGYLKASDEAWRSWGEALGGGVAQGINAVVSGIQSLIDLLTSAYDKAVAFGTAIKEALTWGGGGGGSMPAVNPMGDATSIDGARAMGGPILAGRSYLVGEEGPEVITAGGSGYVHPNGSAMGGGITVNQTLTLNVAEGGGNIRKLAAEVGRVIRDETDKAMRGLHADYGLKLS